MRKESTASNVGLLAAFAASLCCITPLIALIAGVSGAASSLSWLEPFRPYLVAVAVLALGIAWWQTFRAKDTVPCIADGSCAVKRKPFMASKSFLFLLTAAAVLLVAFPYYAKAFYPKTPVKAVIVEESTNIQTAIFTIKGMTCAGCEAHVNSELAKVSGVVESVTSYANQNSVVRFDRTKTTVKQLVAAIDKTGYKVVATKLETNGNNN